MCYGCEKKYIDPELKDRIENYYRLEQENKWEQTYYFRTKLYRDSVPIDTYIRDMKKGMEGWELLKFKIKDVRMENNLSEVDIYFKERNTSEGYIKIITQTTTWEKIDGIWYGRDVANRLHLFLNTDLVSP